MATPSNSTRKMVQFPCTSEEHKALRIRAIQEDSNLIELCRKALGLPVVIPDEGDEASEPAKAAAVPLAAVPDK